MLKIIEKSINQPIRIFAKPGVQLIAGCACILVTFEENLVCDICPPGENPFGIIGKSKYIKSNKISFKIKDMTEIWHQRMIFQTDNFESSNYYPGDKLYVGELGMLTNEPIIDDEKFVARLTGQPTENKDFYEALWL